MSFRLQIAGRFVRLSWNLTTRYLIRHTSPTTFIRAVHKDESDDLPWYLRESIASPISEEVKANLPEVPKNSPESLKVFMSLLMKEYNMQDIQLFDLRDKEISHSGYAIICTGRSEKHNSKAASELRGFLKHKYNHLTNLEGLVSTSITPLERRRLARRPNKTPSATSFDYGKSANSWILCDTGIDNITIHMFTSERRQELDLETLWNAEREPEAPADSSNSDSIFQGVKRYMHTDSSTPKTIYTRLLNETDCLTSRLSEYLEKFERLNVNSHPDDYNLKFSFYRSIFLLNSHVLSLNQVAEVLLAKYTNLEIMADKHFDIKKERAADTVRLLKLLIDNNEKEKSVAPKERIDTSFYKLSEWFSLLYRFSKESFDLTCNHELIPLLLRLTFITNGPFISTRDVEDVIFRGQPIISRADGPLIIYADNRNRDITDFLRYYGDTKKMILTHPVKELILYIYGNAGKWEKFWSEWTSSFGVMASESRQPETAMSNWIKLVVFLAIKNDERAVVHFFNVHWNDSQYGYSFLADFAANGSKFNSPEEKLAFQRSMLHMLEKMHVNAYPDIRKFVQGI